MLKTLTSILILTTVMNSNVIAQGLEELTLGNSTNKYIQLALQNPVSKDSSEQKSKVYVSLRTEDGGKIGQVGISVTDCNQNGVYDPDSDYVDIEAFYFQKKENGESLFVYELFANEKEELGVRLVYEVQVDEGGTQFIDIGKPVESTDNQNTETLKNRIEELLSDPNTIPVKEFDETEVPIKRYLVE
ncbi:hypothetical protein HQ533_00875 [Candidatus Woesearchaeota archaeon]|nr:hypothetical protein [Candidatus Woesearchaeota archaeon]